MVLCLKLPVKPVRGLLMQGPCDVFVVVVVVVEFLFVFLELLHGLLPSLFCFNLNFKAVVDTIVPLCTL